MVCQWYDHDHQISQGKRIFKENRWTGSLDACTWALRRRVKGRRRPDWSCRETWDGGLNVFEVSKTNFVFLWCIIFGSVFFFGASFLVQIVAWDCFEVNLQLVAMVMPGMHVFLMSEGAKKSSFSPPEWWRWSSFCSQTRYPMRRGKASGSWSKSPSFGEVEDYD